MQQSFLWFLAFAPTQNAFMHSLNQAVLLRWSSAAPVGTGWPPARRIIHFLSSGLLRGYALLIPYWSNECGGTVLFVDELFVSPQFCGRGIASRFFTYLAAKRPFNAVGVALEVGPGNERAQRFYESLGFGVRRHALLSYQFPGSAPTQNPLLT